jgi:hypothetical protein
VRRLRSRIPKGCVVVAVVVVHLGKVGVVSCTGSRALVDWALVTRACKGDRAVVHVVTSRTPHGIPLGLYAKRDTNNRKLLYV